MPHSDPVPKGGSDPNVTPVPGNKPATHTTSRGQTPVPSRVGILSSSGVLGATHVVGRGTLPFTGFPLWIAVLLTAALIAVGLTLRRRFSS